MYVGKGFDAIAWNKLGIQTLKHILVLKMVISNASYSRESNKRVEGITVRLRQFLLKLNSPILNNCPAYDILKNS